MISGLCLIDIIQDLYTVGAYQLNIKFIVLTNFRNAFLNVRSLVNFKWLTILILNQYYMCGLKQAN